MSQNTLQLKTAVVIPCFQESTRVLNVIKDIGSEVSQIIVIDDACPDRTGEHVKKHCADPRVQVLTHKKNTGVGGATISGYKQELRMVAKSL